MIKLKELLTINEMSYNEGPSERHQRRMDRITPLFEDLVIEDKPFPENSSRKTLEELKYLATLKSDKKFVEENDDIKDRFKKLHKELNIEFNKEEATDLLKQSVKHIFDLKYKYQRPRPHQVAEYYGIDLKGTSFTESMKTPSYPSGHAVQGHLLGKFYANKYSQFDKWVGEEFIKVGEDIAHSRLIAKAHFPSDKEFGIKLAEKLFDHLI